MFDEEIVPEKEPVGLNGNIIENIIDNTNITSCLSLI